MNGSECIVFLKLNCTNNSRDLDVYRFSKSNNGMVIAFVLMLFVLLCDMAVGAAMRHAKNMTFSTKFYTCMSFLLDSLFVVNLLVIVIARTIFGYNEYFNSSLILTIRIIISLSWVTITLLVVDKAVCLYFPIQYLKYASARRVVLATLVIYIAVTCLKLVARFLIIPYSTGHVVSVKTVSDDGPILTWILGVCLFLDISSYFAISKVLKRHVRSIMDSNISVPNQMRAYKTSRTIILVFFIFIIVHIPLFFVLIYQDFNSESVSLRYASLIAMLSVCCTNPILYAFRFSECRYILITFVSKVFPCLRKKAEVMRLEIYNIVTSSQ